LLLEFSGSLVALGLLGTALSFELGFDQCVGSPMLCIKACPFCSASFFGARCCTSLIKSGLGRRIGCQALHDPFENCFPESLEKRARILS
jgi:hypothetical protein